MKVALIQQPSSPDRQDNLQRGVDAFRRASQAGAELIAFPELSFLRFLPQHPATAKALSLADTVPCPSTEIFSSLDVEHRAVCVLFLLERDGEKTYDTSPVIDADGRIAGIVRMAHIMEGPGFHERGFYRPGDRSSLVFETRAGRIGIAICYDRHFPEYMRALALQRAEIVIIPQAGAIGEWPEGIFEAEIRIAAFQNGYFAALANRVGREEVNHFAGESFVVDPDGRVIARAPRDEDCILLSDCDLTRVADAFAKKHFLEDRRPGFYRTLGLVD